MKNLNYYNHLLAGSEVFIDKGKEYAEKRYPLPKEFRYSDAMLCKLGEAILSHDLSTLNILATECTEIKNRIEKHYPNEFNKHGFTAKGM